MNEFVFSVLIIVHCLCLIFTVKYFYKKNNKIYTIIFGLGFIYDILLQIYPTIFSLFTKFILEQEIYVTPEELLKVYTGEVIFSLLFLISFFYFHNRTYVSNYEDKSVSPRRESFFILIFIIFSCAYSVLDIINPKVDPNLIISHAEIKVHRSLLEMIVYWFSGMFKTPGMILSAYVLIEKKYSKKLRFLSLFNLLVIFFSALFIGWRGPLLWVPVLILVSSYLNERYKYIKVAVFVIILIIPAFSFTRTYIRANSIIINSLSIDQRIGYVVSGYLSVLSGEINIDESRGSIFTSYAERGAGLRNSAFLYRLYDQGREGGISPIVSSLYFPIPRFIWSEKRPPGSTDNTNYGAAIFLAQSQRGESLSSMGPITVSAHAYWEGGYLWLIISALTLGWFWSNLLKWVEKRGLIGFVILMIFSGSLLIDGLYTYKQILYSIITTFWAVAMPTYLVHQFITRFKSK